MEENSDSSSKSKSNRQSYQNHDRQDYNYGRQNYRQNYDNRHQNYNNNYNYGDSDLFIWVASIKRFEDYIHLFLVIWKATGIQGDRLDLSEQFNDEISQMTNHIEDLFKNSAINNKDMMEYSSLLDVYRDHRYNDVEASKKLASNSYSKLKRCGINKYHDQLLRLKSFQKKWIRQIILDRMESFVGITSQTHIVEEGNDLSLNDPIVLRKEFESLRKQNSALVKENSHYQASLGNMTSSYLSDQDPNNATILNSDITELQQLLSEFTMVQGPEYKINEKESIDLFSQYNCQMDFSNQKAKLILGGILQRCVIEQILGDVNSYFKNVTEIKDSDETIELDILNTTESLIQFVNHLNEKRPGKDDITQTIPIKVRQQIYAALGCRGFSNDNHPFIVGTAKRICETMNKFREIIDNDMFNEIDAQSIQITREVIKIFYFRLKTQQTVPTYHFFQSGDEIDNHLMQGSWSREDVKKLELEVEVCYFPCIGIIDKENLSNQKVFTKAQVYARKRNNTEGGVFK